MEIYTMLQIPSMSPALLLSVAGPVRSECPVAPASSPTHVSPWQVRSIVSDVPQRPQVDQVRTQAELVRDPQSVAYGALDAQGTGVSLVNSGNESLQGRNGSMGSNKISGNKGMTVETKRAFGGARGVPPRGRPV
ncbi:hypothetical protein [Catenuloplanes atrovinosus]|uniref:Uncharacterized protein n=1 Tax=Catenuloplanes atrovinosus TaxID=137266 RepID=A0AAE4CGN5_9ACTN|nr:hypothetical protein [Catenuloplanes atrovinosus]MDR7280890.1 hypothetical protein [Catenuloplanes atrovinosus]